MKLSPEGRIDRADKIVVMLASEGGKMLQGLLEVREKEILDAMIGEDCRRSRAYEVFAGRVNEIRDIRCRLKFWIDDGDKAKDELLKLTQKGASRAT